MVIRVKKIPLLQFTGTLVQQLDITAS